MCFYCFLKHNSRQLKAKCSNCPDPTHFCKSVHLTRKNNRFVYRWTVLPTFTSGKWECSAICLSDNQALVVGGTRQSKEADLLTRDAEGVWKWRSITPMVAGHSFLGIALLNGRILVAGGRCSAVELLTISADDPRDLGQWTLLTPLGRFYGDTHIASFAGRILIFSKFHHNFKPLL